jgi:hypothetical protein
MARGDGNERAFRMEQDIVHGREIKIETLAENWDFFHVLPLRRKRWL